MSHALHRRLNVTGYVSQALDALQCLPSSPAKRSLEMMVDYVLDRLY